MSDGHCQAGERCSCGLDREKRAKCALWKAGTQKAEKVFGLLAFSEAQKPLIDKHCFGDCGKVSMGGVIHDDMVGGLWVCCETRCPWLEKQMDEPYGTTMSFGRTTRSTCAFSPTSPPESPMVHDAHTYDVLCVFKKPFIGSDWIRGVEAQNPQHAVMQAQAEVARRKLPPSTYSARLVDESSYRQDFLNSERARLLDRMEA